MQITTSNIKQIYSDKNDLAKSDTSSVLNNVENVVSDCSTPVRLAKSLGLDGREFNKFRIEDLRKGHFGIIETVHNVDNTKSFAVKYPREHGKEYFKSEHTILLKLQEKEDALNYVVQVGEVQESKNTFGYATANGFVPVFGLKKYKYDLYDYFATQSYKGDCDEDDLENKFQFALKLSKQLLEAVNFIHSNNVTHRDLKPENILYDEDDDLWKLCDFGLAVEELDNLTKLYGTAQYIAPEMFRNLPHNSKIDMWAVGCIVYEALTDNLLPDVKQNQDLSVDIKETYRLRNNESPIDLSEIPDATPENLKSFVKNLLEKDPEKRWTAKEALKDFN